MRNFLNQPGVYFKLMNDLDLSSWLSDNYPTQGWQPVGSASTPFKGIFDGNGKTISGFSITRASTDYVGLFAVVDGATIKNLTLKGDIKGKGYVGSLFGSGSATVTNYSFEGTVTGTGSYVGGVGGMQSTASSSITVSATVQGGSYTGGIYGNGAGITTATFTGNVTGTGSNVGGLEGKGGGTFSSCTVNGPVKSTSSSANYVGGLIGYASSTSTATGCQQTGNVQGKSYTGGLVGYASLSITFQNNCTQTGKVTGGEYTGGLVGYASSSFTANNCSQKGDINGTGNYVGGLVGYVGSSSTAANCSHEGSVSGQQYTGGSVGYAAGGITLNNSTQRGNVTGTTQTGGIIGYTKGTVSLTSCFAEGDITGTTPVGGICGQIENPSNSSISACSFWGNISGTSQLGGVVGMITTSYDDSPDFTSTTTAGYKKCATSGTSFRRTACFYNVSSPSLHAGIDGGYIDSKSEIVTATDINGWVVDKIAIAYRADAGYIADWMAPHKVYNNKSSEEKGTRSMNILNCSAVGNINGTGTYIGGIVGQDISGNSVYYTLSQSKTVYYYEGDGVNTATTALRLYEYTPYYTRTKITESYFSGNLTGTNYIGGIAGNKNGGCINNCYASGCISGTQYVGGIAGRLTKDSDDTTENSLNANASICTSITGTSDVGKIYGATDGKFSVAELNGTRQNRSLATMKMTVNGVIQVPNDNLQNGAAVGIAWLRLKANYKEEAWGWNFSNYWTIIDAQSFPYKSWQTAPPVITGNIVSGATTISGRGVSGGTVYIKIGNGDWQPVNCTGTSFTLSGFDPLQVGTVVQLYAKITGKEASYISQYIVDYQGSGTEADPWLVCTAEDIQGIYKAGYYKQMNDIDLTSWISANSATAGWIPVGYNGTDPVIYDGDNHKVTGLWTNRTTNYTGLFSRFAKGTIRNLTVEVATGKQVKGGDYTGIVIGNIDEGTIENVTAKGNVSAGKFAGGIAGYTSDTTLKQLSYTGQITANGTVGGITSCCRNNNTITNCKAMDITINATPRGTNECIGGLVGSPGASPFNNCKVSGTITVTSTSSNTGVLLGGLAAYTNGTITECATNVTISNNGTGTSGMTAGLVARNSGTITECATNATISNDSPNGFTAGLVAENRGTISRCSAAGTVTSTVTSTEPSTYTGGLVAKAADTCSVIEDCYSTADVTGEYSAGLVAYNYGNVNRCYASGDVTSTYFAAGLVGYNDGKSAIITNCVALCSKLETSGNAGSWSIRVIGGNKNGAPEPVQSSNYAWIEMQMSANGIAKPIPADNSYDGTSITTQQTKDRSTYESLSWDFENVWTMPSNSYPVLQWQNVFDGMKGDLNGDGEVKIDDVVLIIHVIAGIITDANQVAAADVNNDGRVMINDCVEAIFLIAGQVSTPNSARRKAHALLSDTEYISGAMEDNQLTISLDNEKRYTAFQMIVSVPDGMTLGKATMDEMRGAGHQAIIRNLGGGQYLVAGFSGDNEELTGSSGRLLSIATNGQATGDIVISDIEFATTQAEAYYLADEVVSTIATGIEGLLMSGNKGNKIYDLQGRRVMNPTKGLYIVNGKKVNLK